jgi:hypothetical protein
MTWVHRLDAIGDLLQLGLFALLAGIAFGIPFGRLTGACAAAGIAAVFFVISRAARAVHRRANERSLRQRRPSASE